MQSFRDLLNPNAIIISKKKKKKKNTASRPHTEEDIRQVDRKPARKPGRRAQAHEPVEHLRRAARDVHEREEHGCGRREHGRERQPRLCAVAEDPRRLPAQREPVEDARGAEEEGVARGEGGGEDGCVDDVREDYW